MILLGWRADPLFNGARCVACGLSRKAALVLGAVANVIAPTDRRRGGPQMAGKFELYKDNSGKFRFRLKAGNGEIIATGEAYESKASAEKGIASVQKNAADAKVVDLTE